MRKPLLFLPGPMQVPDHIRAGGDRPMFNHRSPEMDHLLHKLEIGCQALLGGTPSVLFFSSSGTGAMESAIANMTSPGEEIIVLAGGVFAERWVEIGTAFGLRVHAIPVDWRRGATGTDLADAMARFPGARVVYATWSESSTGVLLDLAELGSLVRAQGKYLVVDAVSGLAVSPMAMNECQVDAVISGSQKGLMLPPGLGIAAVGLRAWQRSASATMPRYYWDWRKYTESTPFTPPTTILFQLDLALNYIQSVGLPEFFARRSSVARRIRDLVSQAGFSVYAHRPGDGITTVEPPASFDIPAFKQRLEEQFGIQIGGGLGPLQGTTFRIGHVGFISDEEMTYFIQSFRSCL